VSWIFKCIFLVSSELLASGVVKSCLLCMAICSIFKSRGTVILVVLTSIITISEYNVQMLKILGEHVNHCLS
jgi:hypothetical protein